MRAACLLAVIAPLLSGSIAAREVSGPTSSVPFELKGGHIFVSAYVNGKGPYRFGFDTGASGMGRADMRLRSELSLPKIGEEQNSDGIKTVTTDVVEANSVRLGVLKKSNVRLLSRDYNGGKTDPPFVMGIIGRDFVGDRLLTIDYPHRTLSLTSGSLKAGAAGVVAYGRSFTIPVCFHRRCYQAAVDTGSSMSLVLPKEVALAVAKGPARHIGTGRRMNSTSELYEVAVDEPVKVGGVNATNVRVAYTDPSDGRINIGSDFLKDYVLTIDQGHHLLRISKPAD